jgi:hypothetical protein
MSFSARIASAVSVAVLAFAVIVLASLSQHGATSAVASARMQAVAAAATPSASATTDGLIWD